MKIIIETTFEKILQDISDCGHIGYMKGDSEGARDYMDQRIEYYQKLLSNNQIKLSKK